MPAGFRIFGGRALPVSVCTRCAAELVPCRDGTRRHVLASRDRVAIYVGESRPPQAVLISRVSDPEAPPAGGWPEAEGPQHLGKET